MLIVSDFAAATIRRLLERHNAPDDAGSPVAGSATTRSLKIRIARAPARDDMALTAALDRRRVEHGCLRRVAHHDR
jgi:hypothetical protein